MADRVLFIGWGAPVRGREERGLEERGLEVMALYQESVAQVPQTV
jgi:hypothetical protein